MPRLLRREIERSLVPPWGGTVEATIFGTRDVDTIVARVDDACVRTFGSHLDDGFLYSVSVGCVFGCELADGRRVVLKAYQPRWTPTFLSAVRRVQHHLHHLGFACPEPIGEVTTIDGATFVAESELADPGIDAGFVGASAAGLAEVVRLCGTLDEPDLAHHPMRLAHDGPFPEPHSPIFDFVATSAGAEWLEGLAYDAAAIAAEDSSAPVIAHTDWSLRNVRMRSDSVVAVYDWDSLALVKESDAIGIGAATWSRLGEPADATPSADEIGAFIDAYDDARDAPLSSAQRRAARAAAVGTMAYTARCEHSLDPDEQVWTATRSRLRSDARTLLA